MRRICKEEIADAVCKLFLRANNVLPADAEALIKDCTESETDARAKSILSVICKNLDAARELDVPICQDTGMAVVFAEIGYEVALDCPLQEAVDLGVRRAYLDNKLRCSVVSDPLFERKNTVDNTPAILHTTIVSGDRLKLTVAPKGFGSENMSAVCMLKPSASPNDVINFVVDSVKKAGANPCPPILVGVGIGGDFEQCAMLAKKALTRNVSRRNPDARYAELESKILDAVNKTGIGPQGIGGDTTAFAVNIEYAPTHIAGLPCAVNINCHVMRHAEAIL